MNRDLIEAKLESLRRCIRRIESKTPATKETLHEDLDLQDIIVLNLERAVQTCVDIAMHMVSNDDMTSAPTSMGDAFRAMEERKLIEPDIARRMIKAVGFRNTAVHAYRQVDYDIVFAIVTNHLDDFRNFTTQVMRALPE